jgi:N-acetylneuraminic acid mutarotase
MTHPLPLNLGLTVGVLALAACGEPTAPTQPGTAGDPSSAVPSFVLASNSWTTKAPFPRSFLSGIAVGVRNNSAGLPIVYVFGGNFLDIQSSTISAYNPSTNTWADKSAPFLAGHSWTNGVGRIGGKLYISGGYSVGGGGGTCADDIPPVFDCDDPTNRRLLYRYDPATNTWTTLVPAPRNHQGGVGGVINGKFYVAGGGSSTALDVYNPATNMWRRLAPLPQSQCCVAGAVMNSKLWVIGWYDTNRNTYAYDPVTNTWKRRAPLPAGRMVQGAVSLPFDGHSHLFVVGATLDEADEPAPSLLYTP